MTTLPHLCPCCDARIWTPISDGCHLTCPWCYVPLVVVGDRLTLDQHDPDKASEYIRAATRPRRGGVATITKG